MLLTILFDEHRDNDYGPLCPLLKKRVKKINSRSVKKEKLFDPDQEFCEFQCPEILQILDRESSFLLAQWINF
jgi:hypothetical protein